MSQILAHNKVGKDTMYVIMTHTNPRRVVALRGFFCPGSSPGLLLCNQTLKCIASCDTIHSKAVVFLVLPHSRLQSTAEAARTLYALRVVAFEHEQDLQGCYHVLALSLADKVAA